MNAEHPAASLSERLAALNAAANRHGGDHELSAVCSHLHSELPKLAAERDRYKAALELIAGGEYADAAENVAGDVLSRV